MCFFNSSPCHWFIGFGSLFWEDVKSREIFKVSQHTWATVWGTVSIPPRYNCWIQGSKNQVLPQFNSGIAPMTNKARPHYAANTLRYVAVLWIFSSWDLQSLTCSRLIETRHRLPSTANVAQWELPKLCFWCTKNHRNRGQLLRLNQFHS